MLFIIEIPLICLILTLFAGKYHQYDNIVLPTSQEKSRLGKFLAFFGWSGNPSHDEMQKKCLDVYLTSHKETIRNCELSPSLSNIPQAANGIVHIFRQLFSQKIHQYMSNDWISPQLPKVCGH